MANCPDCGMPEELCVCDTIAKEEEKIEVRKTRRSYGKELTIVENVSEDMNPEELAKKLKKNLACGGTYKEGRIELQGDHLRRIKDILIEEGFPEGKIEIKN
ncbi:MAG: stress response translation initiation inhibitor YciH [Candidatus Aenigmatarchaeota archaeon]